MEPRSTDTRTQQHGNAVESSSKLWVVNLSERQLPVLVKKIKEAEHFPLMTCTILHFPIKRNSCTS